MLFCLFGVSTVNTMSRHKDKYEPTNPRRSHTFMQMEEVQAGKKSQWMELEITGECIF